MRKILAINGSHKGANGFTHSLLKRIESGVVEAESQFEIINLADKSINICKACDECQKDGRLGQCLNNDKDDVQEIFEKMKVADIILYATPIYVFSMTGLMKLFFDRFYSTSDDSALKLTQSGLLFHNINMDIYGKPFAYLVTSDNLEERTTKNAVDYFEAFSEFMDAPNVGALVRRGGKIMGYGEKPELKKDFPAIDEILDSYVQVGRELAANGAISKKTEATASQSILPISFFKKLLSKTSIQL